MTYRKTVVDQTLPPLALRARTLTRVVREMQAQDNKWGEQNHTDEWWLAILTEEVGEAAQSLLHDKFGGKAAGTLPDEIIQIAAVAIQWAACIQRRAVHSVEEYDHAS